MTCALCGATNPAESGYCNRCGVMLGLTCPQCEAANNPKARRCGACGAVLQADTRERPATRAPRESRRIVTVLFADIVGYTSMVESYSGRTEAVRSLLKESFDGLAGLIHEHGGTVEKFIGDAVCALFGAPVVHEDDPERALRCALAMQRSMSRLNGGHQAGVDEDMQPLALRIGVSTGEVVGGTAEHAGQPQYSVTGDAVNTAARLQTSAEAGQILVSSATERVTRRSFHFEPAGEIKLKGKRQPVPAFLLYGETPAEAIPGSDLVDRRRELEHLGYCLHLAAEGDAQLVELVGDAGVGKTRLLNAFLQQSAGDAIICWGTCPPTAAGPLYAFQSIAAELLQGLSSDGAQADGVTTSREILETLASASLTDVDESVEAIRGAFDGVVKAIAVDRPVVIILENVHRADHDTLLLLQRIMTSVANQRLMLLWSRRTGEEMVSEGDYRASFTRLNLKPLSEQDADQLLMQLLGAKDIAPRLRALIVQRSGGNPLYIDAMVQTLEETGGLSEAASLDNVEIPATVQGLIQARLDNIPEGQRLLLQEAAVVGREFDAEILKRVDLFGLDVELDLEGLTRLGMIERLVESRYRFRHVMTQEVAYDTMLQGLRSELHREVAEALLDMSPERLGEMAPVLADHYAKAGDTDRAVEILVQAGQTT